MSAPGPGTRATGSVTLRTWRGPVPGDRAVGRRYRRFDGAGGRGRPRRRRSRPTSSSRSSPAPRSATSPTRWGSSSAVRDGRHADRRPHRPDAAPRRPRRRRRRALGRPPDASSTRSTPLFSVTPEAIAATLVVTSPTGAETEYPLRYGDNLVGRDLDCDVVIKDQQASRRHARINVTDVVTITDLGSKNGVVVGGHGDRHADRAATGHRRRDRRPRRCRSATTCAPSRRSPRATASSSTARRASPGRTAGSQVELPAPPERPRKQRLPMISAVIPVVLGVGMYFLLGPIGAIFMLLSPVLLIASWIEAKRTGQFEFKEALAEHRSMLAEQVRAAGGRAGAGGAQPLQGDARRPASSAGLVRSAVGPAVGAGARRRRLPAPAARAPPSCRRAPP